jgi:acyl dehydratase
MPLHTALVGATTRALEHAVDARWLMAYAASLNDLNPRYLDTQAGTVVGHPVFPVCLEWPVILNTREMAGAESLTPQESARGVHAAHDLHIYRPIKAGDRLATHSQMVDIRQIKPGAAYTMQLDTVDVTTGELVARTYQLGIYRGVAVEGPQAAPVVNIPTLPELADCAAVERFPIAVSAGAAHTYTECARIWNPIHTDRAVALAAGLPDIILHGTATLALAIGHIVQSFAGDNPDRIARLGGRFSAMVLMPSKIQVQATRVQDIVSFRVLTQDGQEAISNGFAVLRS